MAPSGPSDSPARIVSSLACGRISFLGLAGVCTYTLVPHCSFARLAVIKTLEIYPFLGQYESSILLKGPTINIKDK
jgi:hypothetical protein